MIYRDLLEQLRELDSDQLDMDVVLFNSDSGEYHKDIEFNISNSTDDMDLESTQPYLTFEPASF